jgi:hypothetical protein
MGEKNDICSSLEKRPRLNGIIHQFAVGGQELWIDDVCPELGYRVLLPIVLKDMS